MISNIDKLRKKSKKQKKTESCQPLNSVGARLIAVDQHMTFHAYDWLVA